MAPGPSASAATRRETADTWTLALEPAGGGAAAGLPPGPVQHALRVRRRRGADLDQRRPGRGRGRSCTRCARSGRSSAAICRARPGDQLGRARALRERLAAGRRRRPRRRDRRRRHRAGAAAPGPAGGALPARAARGRGRCSTAAARREQLLFRSELDAWQADPRLELGVTVDSAEAGWHGNVGVVTTLIDRAPFDPARTVAFVCGPEVMMRFTVEALLARGDGRERRLRLDRAQHEVRDQPLRPLPVRPDLRLPRRPGVALRRDRALLQDPGALMGAAGRAEAGGLEVRLLRRLPAQPARLRGRAAGAGRGDRDRLLPRGLAGDGRGPLRPLAGRGLDHDAGRRRADPGGAARLPAAGHDRRLRDRRRDPGAAQLRRRGRVRRPPSTRPPSTSRRSRPRPRSAPTCRSTSSCRAARSTSASCSR